jgi:hypothetical protein
MEKDTVIISITIKGKKKLINDFIAYLSLCKKCDGEKNCIFQLSLEVNKKNKKQSAKILFPREQKKYIIAKLVEFLDQRQKIAA